jgi:hypothetical protein
VLFFFVYIASHPRRFFSAKPLRSQRLCVRFFPRLSPNSFPLSLFADPHPLTPVVSIFYENIAGARRLSRPSNSQPSTFDFQPPILHKPFTCNTYEPLRKCCKQKTYGLPKSFSCNTYKKHGGGGIFPGGKRQQIPERQGPHFRILGQDPCADA